MPEPPFLGTVTPDEFRRIRAIFEAALDLPPAERRAFVEQACGGERALVGEVERMLATEGDRHQLLDRGSTGDATGGTTGRRPAVPRVCPSCHAPLTAAHRFCQSCGTPTAAGSLIEEGASAPARPSRTASASSRRWAMAGWVRCTAQTIWSWASRWH